MSELKPAKCPLCNQDVRANDCGKGASNGCYYIVQCDCGLYYTGPYVDWSPETDTEADSEAYLTAINAWNRRAPAAGGWPTPEQAKQLLAVREALLNVTFGEEQTEAWHELYRLADPTFCKFEPWAEWERLAATLPSAEPGEGK